MGRHLYQKEKKIYRAQHESGKTKKEKMPNMYLFAKSASILWTVYELTTNKEYTHTHTHKHEELKFSKLHQLHRMTTPEECGDDMQINFDCLNIIIKSCWDV